jgi:hypothetical protein
VISRKVTASGCKQIAPKAPALDQLGGRFERVPEAPSELDAPCPAAGGGGPLRLFA